MKRYLALCASLVMMAGCPASDDGTGDDTLGDSVNDTASDAVGDTTGNPDGDTAGDSANPSDTDTTSEVTGDTIADGGADIDTSITPGAFGYPCDSNDDCNSGYCLDAYAGKVCSTTCTDGCVDGWSCRQDLTVFPDIVYVCVPSFPTLCSPCDSNASCEAAGASEGARCLPRGEGGADGSFCGGGCAGAACPEGYRCEAAVDINGRETPQCVPADGAECECSGPAIAEAASTTCRERNELGTCVGTRVCTLAGLTDCNARVPAEDTCNGLDDDCDGTTDEAHFSEGCLVENTFGACPGSSVCRGLTGLGCEGPEPQAERCDAVDNDCDGATDEQGASGCVDYWVDADGDGVGTGAPQCQCGPSGDFTAQVDGDCDDSLGTVQPNAPEICDGLDNDCDSLTDDAGAIGCSIFYRDGDLDQFGNQDDSRCLCEADVAGRYTSKTPTDCNDAVGAINPGAPEVCDGVDNDCDRVVDEQGAGGCTLHFVDGDGDTYGNPGQFACLCGPDTTFAATRGGDCDDDAGDVNPGAAEQCDTKDNDCDGLTDESDADGCVAFYRDSDGDDFGVTSDSRCLCAPAAPWDATASGDCNDAVASVNPAAAEVCNGQDDDCDTAIDELGADGCDIYYRDTDFDSFGQAGDSACLCAPTVPYVSTNALDCDDDNPFANPSAAEVCNQVDDDCDEEVDEGVQGNCSPFYFDGDDDGWGLADQSQCLCAPEGLFRAVKAGDCNDVVMTTHPFAPELCNGVDDDCDGTTDEEGATGCTQFYRDVDNDGVGRFGEVKCLCAASGQFRATVGGDCNDANVNVKPGAIESCNDIDDDCDGTIDPAASIGCLDRLRDSDQDGWGVAGDGLCLCEPNAPFTAIFGGDCNDADPTMNPAESELCNGKDDDCSGVADDPGTGGCITFFRDDDGDAWGRTGDSQCLCAPTATYKATNGGDCDDARADVSPAIIERCNGIDDDCDGSTDETGAVGCEIFLRDVDGDTYGVDGDFSCVCAGGDVYRATRGGDCNDSRGDVSVGAPELCDDVDNDCDRVVDEEGAQGCTSWLRDIDGDGYGVSSDSKCLCEATAVHRTQVGGDCNDGSLLISPIAVEFCNGTDDDCDGSIDEEDAVGCLDHFVDGDEDGWGVGAGRCLCGASGAFVVTQSGDCADDDELQNPGLVEECNEDGRDENCDGDVDEANAIGCTDFFRDADDDLYGVTTSRTCLCGAEGDLTATTGGDCDDSSDLLNPGEVEVCNGKDDDCDGAFDEGCGMQVGGWPTAKYDHRRSGWGVAYDGPGSKTLKWKTRLNTDTDGNGADLADIQTSAVFDTTGRLYIAVENRLYRINPTTGVIVWQVALAQPMSSSASITLRTGGTMVIPTGNGVSLFDRDGVQLWYRKLPGAETEPITGAPLVDNDGNIYVVGFSAAYSLDSAGQIRWSVAVPNSQYVQSHVAWNQTNDRIYFGCSNHTLFAMTRTGQIAWTYVVQSADVDASTVVLLDGTLVQSFGSAFHQVRDDGTVATKIRDFNTGGDNDTPPIAWRNSSNQELIISNANGSSGVRTYRANDGNLNWTYAMTKDGDIPNATGAIDKTGRIYVGDDEAGFHAITTTGTQLWKFEEEDGLEGDEIQSTVALQQGVVFFSDDAGWLYAIGQ